METVYEAAGGNEGMLRLAEAWHQRVMADEIVSHAFSHGFEPDHSERLAAYWTEALGGPAAYTGKYGDETSVVRIHSGNGEHTEMNERDGLIRPGARSNRSDRRAAPAGAARLLCLGHHDDHGALPPRRRGRSRGLDDPAMVLGRPASLTWN
jgi:hypothetical protein